MEELRNQYEQIIEQTDRMVFVVERETEEILYANQAACTQLHWDTSTCIGRKVEEFLNTEVERKLLTWAKRSLVAKRSIVEEDREEGKFYRVICKKDIWGEKEALFIYLTDCSRERLLEEQERNHYKRSFRSIIEVNRHAVSSFQINVSKDLVIDAYCKYPTLRIQNSKTLSQFADAVIEQVPNKEQAEIIKEKMNQAYLLKIYEEGQTSIRLEHEYLVEKDVKARFLSTLTMLKNPLSGEIEGVIYTHDVTGSYLERHIKNVLWKKQYLHALIVLIPSHKMVEYNGLDGSTPIDQSQLGETIDYDEGRLNLTEKYIVPEEREEFLRKTDLAQIVRNLKRDGEYSFITRNIEESGETKYLRYSYAYLDEFKDTLICTAENVAMELEQDVLTKVLNRRGFIHHVEDAFRLNPMEEYAILFFDIQHFKAINERFGVRFGDGMLEECARYLKESDLHPILTSRVGGDHFALLIKQESLNYDALRHICLDQREFQGCDMNVNLTCGIFMVDDKNRPVSGMIDRAKLAREYIEDAYVKPYSMFDASMRIAYMAKNELNNDITYAFKNNEFLVYYQPIYHTYTEELVGAEALVRWNHPSRGIISPAFFIPNLEESGQIAEVDFFVAESVKKFIEQRYRDKKKVVPVDVNLTWLDFFDKEGMKNLIQSVQTTEASSDLFRFEVTESTYTSVMENANHMLDQLREEGCEILMDDFGTGYSSFATLNAYDFDILKLDQGFVRKIGFNKKTEAIIESVVEMAHKLGSKVVAEGVENMEQLDYLRKVGCDFIQGYFFSKPVPEDEFARMLDESQIVIS